MWKFISCDAMYIMKYYFKSPILFVFFQYSRRDAFKCIVNMTTSTPWNWTAVGVLRGKNGLRRGPAGLNRSWTFDPCTPCFKICTPTFKILPNTLEPPATYRRKVDKSASQHYGPGYRRLTQQWLSRWTTPTGLWLSTLSRHRFWCFINMCIMPNCLADNISI